ncbi:hypothetical protein FKM82_002559 [Ascaphus truei]
MKNSTGATLDLTFLTEEEYEKLMKVLQRDADLQKKDSDRIRRVQGSLKDEKKKKFVTGEWFQDVKARRFQEDLQGSDLLRASIRRKKNRTPAHSNGTASDSKEESLLPSTVQSRVDRGIERLSDVKDDADRRRALSQSKPTLPVAEQSLLCAADKRGRLSDVSPVDSGTGVCPSLATETLETLELRGKGGHEIPPIFPTSLSAYDENESENSTPMERSLSDTKASPVRQSSQEEGSSPSKIPVKMKPSKGASRPEFTLHLDQSNSSATKIEAIGNRRLSSPEADFGKELKSGSNFTVNIMKDKPKEEESFLDRGQFMTLKTFWEKGADTAACVNNNSDQELTDMKSSQEPSAKHSFVLNSSASLQPNKSQNGEEKPLPDLPHKIRHPPQRTAVVSSSEDEQFYVAPPRKGSSSSIPRATYGKSKGSPISKRVSLSESNGTTSHSEESSGTGRSSKKSKLPIRAPPSHQERMVDPATSPRVETLASISEPEGPSSVEEYVVSETRQHFQETLHSRVQILIDTITSVEEPSSLVTQDDDKTSKDMTGKASSEVENGGSVHEYPEIALSRAKSMSNARSMVNIYTTTETYNKPQTLTHQLLEPDRAKDLSKSSPALLSETESDTASEISFQLKRHARRHSSGSNSSDMASVSSVSNSVLSVYSGDFGSVDAQGTVQFSLDYDEKNREFQIYVAQCKDLAVVDEKKGRSDPYVKTYLLPDKARMGKRKTSVKRRTTNPVYNEVLRYKIEKMVLLIQKLNLSVWHNDPLGRNSFLGEMEIDLTCWDWSITKPNWYTLKPRSLSAMNGVDHRGVMNVSVKYIPPGSQGPKHPSSGEVHIWVKDTKDLPQLRPSGVDSFVKCYVLPDTSKKSYQKTRVVKKDSNPVFNHTIVYDGFHTEDLKDACVELTVWDHEKLSNHFLGGIRLGLGTGYSYGITVNWMDSTQEEVALWQEMTSMPNEWIEGSLPLRSLAGKRKFK